TDTARAEATDPADLLDGYRAGEFAFVTPERTVLAAGVDRELTGTDVFALDEALPEEFATAATPVAVGVLPFSDSAPARLVVPNHIRSTGPAHAAMARKPDRVLGTPVRMTAVPSEQQHQQAVAEAVRLLREGQLHKVVLARALDVEFPAQVDPAFVLHNLVSGNPSGFTFAAPLPGPRAATLVGSSPELLVRRVGNRVFAHPHAGTAPRSNDPVEDARNAERLAASSKERTEHSLVVEAVVEGLRPFCRRMTVPSEPSLTSTPAVWHLGTMITGALSDSGTGGSALRLAAALHPPCAGRRPKRRVGWRRSWSRSPVTTTRAPSAGWTPRATESGRSVSAAPRSTAGRCASMPVAGSLPPRTRRLSSPRPRPSSPRCCAPWGSTLRSEVG